MKKNIHTMEHELKDNANSAKFAFDLEIASPGRINLIGEHTDYNGLAVLPMALDQSVVICFRPRGDDRITLVNAAAAFGRVSFPLHGNIPPEEPGAWGNYIRAAAQAMVRDYGVTAGLDGAVASTLPIAAGLSSSSALVVASGLALLAASRKEAEPLGIMETLARGERYVGVQGGGMDQAVSLGARAGHAVRIAFRPRLELRPVPVPAGWRFVVASSGAQAAKAAGARDAYNARVRESAKALAVMAAHLGLPSPADYAELLERVPAAEALAGAESVLPGLLRSRFRHVVSEAQRVDAAVGAMERGDARTFGRLMSESHESLRADYEVSTPALDRLVETMRDAGALGARLTGAGFGGSVIALAEPDCVDVVLRAARDFGPAGRATLPPFVASPGPGAGVVPLAAG